MSSLASTRAHTHTHKIHRVYSPHHHWLESEITVCKGIEFFFSSSSALLVFPPSTFHSCVFNLPFFNPALNASPLVSHMCLVGGKERSLDAIVWTRLSARLCVCAHPSLHFTFPLSHPLFQEFLQHPPPPRGAFGYFHCIFCPIPSACVLIAQAAIRGQLRETDRQK